MKVTVDSEAILTFMKNALGQIENMEGGLSLVGRYVETVTMAAFRTQQDPTTGKRWASLRPSTVKLRRKGRGIGNPQILQSSGILKQSIHSMITGKRTLEVGANSVYGNMHQHGGTTAMNSMIPGKQIPARPFLGYDGDDEREMEAIMRRWIYEEKFRR